MTTPRGFDSPADAGRARALLEDAGYTEEGLRGRLSHAGRIAWSASHAPDWLLRTAEGTSLDTLARLFLLAAPVPAADAEAALAPLGVATFARAGLVRTEGDEVRGAVLIAPWQGLLLAADHPGLPFPEDFVVPVGQASMLLVRATVRQSCRRTLDLGTGCGVQALLAARHSREVLATDRSERAIALTRLNADLNGVTNLETAAGDGFAPAGERKFDLILCNPPYVIAPPGDHGFRSSGVRGDEFCRRLIREAAARLEDMGFAQFLANWPHAAGAPWTEGLAGWFDDLGCDVVVWGGNTQLADDYVLNWLGDEAPADGARDAGRHARWRGYLAAEGIEAVSYGIVTLHRRTAEKNFVHMDESPKPLAGDCGGYLATAFRVLEYLEEHTFAELLDERLRFADRVRIERREAPDGKGGWLTRESRLTLDGGPVWSGEVEPGVAAFVARCDGSRTVGEILGEIASEMHIPFDRFAPAALNLVCHLLRRGFLLLT